MELNKTAKQFETVVFNIILASESWDLVHTWCVHERLVTTWWTIHTVLVHGSVGHGPHRGVVPAHLTCLVHPHVGPVHDQKLHMVEARLYVLPERIVGHEGDGERHAGQWSQWRLMYN